jgi:putative membrane-bound dehydrogenase-like protein
MNRYAALVLALSLPAPALAGADAPKGLSDWKVEVVAEHPTVNFCSVVACAPDGRVFLAEDPMDMTGPPNQPIDRILCLHPDGSLSVFADKLYAVFGLAYLDGKLYVHHCPKFSVFTDGGKQGTGRTDLIDCTNPRPWGGMNDHIPANIRLGMDGWFYMAVGDKGIYGAVGKDGSKAEIYGGGILRFRPDGTHLEVFSTGTRNHLDMALNAEDDIFTYDNTDDGNGWWTRVTHMVDGGFYGYPYDYKPRRPYALWMMGDYGGGSPTGALAYNEDALPREYHGNLFMCEWGKGQLARFVVKREGGSYKIVRRDAFLTKGTREFRPVGIAVSPDGMSLYLADWNYGGWSNRTVKAGRLIKATYTGPSQAAPKPAWWLPAALGKPCPAATAELVEALRHPAQSVRLVAMRRAAESGGEAVPLLTRLLADTKAPAHARWSAIWALDRIDEGKAGRAAILAALKDADPSVRRQAARQLGTRKAREAVDALNDVLFDDEDRSVRFHIMTALGRIGDARAVSALQSAMGDADLFVHYAAFTALRRIGHADPSAWKNIARGLGMMAPRVPEGTLFAFREAYTPGAVEALAAFALDTRHSGALRAPPLALLGELARKRPAWQGQWWGTQPVRSLPAPRTVIWEGTAKAVATLRAGLRDPYEEVRRHAAKGMVASNDPALAVELVRHIPTEKDAAARKAMLHALAQVRNGGEEFARAADRLAAELLANAADEVLPEVLVLAANLPALSPELTGALLRRAGSDLPAERLIALLEALAKSRSPQAGSALAARLSHASTSVRATALRLLAARPGAEATRALEGALQDKETAIRKDAVIALGKRKDKSAVAALLPCLQDKALRFDAITALAQTPDARAIAAYLEGLGGRNNTQREACARALGAVKAEALPVIEARIDAKPPLASDVVAQLQKIYASYPAAKGSKLLGLTPKTIALEELATVALRQKGDAEHGRRLFFDAKGAACSKCHRVQNEGGEVGPDLSDIATRYNRAQLLESVLYPSKKILDGYDLTVIETKDGLVLSGIVRADTGDELTLGDADGKKHVIKKADIESRVKSDKSLMPDGLEAGMSPSDLADLLSYLESLRGKTPAKTSSSVPMPSGPGNERPEVALRRIAHSGVGPTGSGLLCSDHFLVAPVFFFAEGDVPTPHDLGTARVRDHSNESSRGRLP